MEDDTQDKSVKSPRRRLILDTAREVFLRYGYRKASVDDIARAAGISRQGLYLHFSSKEELFKASVMHQIQKLNTEATSHLSNTNLPLEERLVLALNALHGYTVGLETMDELLSTTLKLVGDIVEGLRAQIIKEIEQVLEESIAGWWQESEGFTSQQLARTLYYASLGFKKHSETPEDYYNLITLEVKLICKIPR